MGYGYAPNMHREICLIAHTTVRQRQWLRSAHCRLDRFPVKQLLLREGLDSIRRSL
jgi:hypothetical protein